MPDLDIVNYALRRLGAEPAASMADTGKNARAAIDSYALVKGKVLRLFPWPLLTVREELLDEAGLAWVGSTAYAVGKRSQCGRVGTWIYKGNLCVARSP